MAVNNPYKTYQDNAVNTASSGELTLMLYNGCLKFLHAGKKAMQDQHIELKNTNIQKAQNIIQELMVTLNLEIEMSQNMLSLYDYMNRQLMTANVKNDLDIMEEVEGMIVELRDTWKQVIQLNRRQQHTGGQA
ncbi:flagellar export chaperone FliS [Bacillus spongiae]|uniref:Flagellar secretion chaperone FliS n=1 Tax=Bacillus spongiae TaxID=2683610 RepID=A0ABU8HEP7_9BACI